MKFNLLKNVKNIIGAVAPSIGTAIGGPMGGMAANMVAEVLGCEPTPQKIEKAVQAATPEQLAELKKIDSDFEIKMKELDVDLYALETQDIQDARVAFKDDWTPKLFGLISLVSFVGYIFTVTIMPPDQNSDTIVSLVLGYLGGLVSGISSFYFGASNKEEKS
jgi:hypothetical protein|tara:strand:- start:3216 stop:3704 length:489 start_codon:yes stop_codon:yes gene_type:complete